MKYIELIAPCHFGLESVLKREILDLGYEISKVEDGRVTFLGDAEAICRANIFLRTAERDVYKRQLLYESGDGITSAAESDGEIRDPDAQF